mgnify:CR=1 FL=1
MLRGLLKKILHKNAVRRLQTIYERIDRYLAALGSVSPWLAVIYYGFWSAEFRREMHTVLKARTHYYSAISGKKPTSYLLRRNIHRLEKGLTMRPRREVFGEGYIRETCDYLSVCLKDEVLLDSEISWALSVLADYFLAVTPTAITESARKVFNESAAYTQGHYDGMSHKPFSSESLKPCKITFEEFRELCIRRRSTRWFESRPVPRQLIESAINVAATAPSACNRQPYKFYIFD